MLLVRGKIILFINPIKGEVFANFLNGQPRGDGIPATCGQCDIGCSLWGSGVDDSNGCRLPIRLEFTKTELEPALLCGERSLCSVSLFYDTVYIVFVRVDPCHFRGVQNARSSW